MTTTNTTQAQPKTDEVNDILDCVYRAGYNKAEHDENPQNVDIVRDEYHLDVDQAAEAIHRLLMEAREDEVKRIDPTGGRHYKVRRLAELTSLKRED